MKPLWVPLCLGLFGACTAPPPHQVIRDYHDTAETGQTADERLQAAAFEHLQGKTRPEAIAFLEADGFQCLGVTCLYFTQKKLSTTEVLFGISHAQDRVFSDRRTYLDRYSLSLVADVIEEPDQIYADAVHQAGRVPWHRSPRPSDLEVTDD